MTPVVRLINKQQTRVTCQSKMLDPTTLARGLLHCHRLASHTINGAPMCKRHAGSFLVDLLESAEDGDCHQ